MAEETEKHSEQTTSESIKVQVIEDEMKKSYLDYAMSVIVGRALPDVRDGLKPVHRRILYAMNQMGLVYNKAPKKSARVVGEVIGKYHPHGDSAVYDTMVRMAQDFSLRYPLVNGQGNFGSIDGDSAAAMRYTEAKMTRLAESMLEDIEKNTVNFRPNYDDQEKEPEVLPAKLPNLLVNGSVGIAVGMATNIPPHNIGEISKAVTRLVDARLTKQEVEPLDLIQEVTGPDFPTGGIIYGKGGILHAYKTGRGKILLRGKTHIEESRNKTAIIIDEIPYQVNKTQLIENIAELVKAKIIKDISDIRDESDREGMRIVIELKKDAQEQIVLNQLFKHTRLQTTFGMIMLSLVKNLPRVLNLKEMLDEFINHRIQVITRRTEFELDKAEKRAHVLLGLKKAIEQLDQTIQIVRKAANPAIAKDELMAFLQIDQVQAQAILDMKLQRLTGLERDKIIDEYNELLKKIEDLMDILANPHRVLSIIKEETGQVNEQYQDSRKTEIVDSGDEIDIEDLIEDEDVVVTISRGGYCKRVGVDTYKAQRRGGKGIIGASSKADDIIENLFVTHSKSFILCFTNKGKVHWLKTYQIPESSRTAIGKHIKNLLPLENGEEVTTYVPVKAFDDGLNLVLATRNGIVKKSALKDYSRPRAGGIRGITLDEDDQLITAVLTNGNEQLMLATAQGMAVKFHEKDARVIGRVARGVRGITLNKGDYVVGMIPAEDDKTVLTITENGFGKRTKISEYRLINRGGKGVINMQTSERNGKIIAIKIVDDEDGIMLISTSGIMMRTRADQISVIGRNTQGVRVMRLPEGIKVAGVSKVVREEETNE